MSGDGCAYCPHPRYLHTIAGACLDCACYSGGPEPHPDSVHGKAARIARLQRQIMLGRPTLRRAGGTDR